MARQTGFGQRGTMRAYDIIRRKRDGETLSDAEIRQFIAGYTADEIPDYQAAALLMAVFFRGLTDRELVTWTEAMLHSGEVVDLSEVPGVKVDKHSTGGVGDKVSLCLAPLVAACGVPVPMVSGRGLGHTGGTLDKLEAIPGFRVDLPLSDYRRIVAQEGLCLIGQTATLAPADRKLYALRDVTGTVESVPLITSSILSKKLAEGIDALVLDVKVGRGAFMKRLEDARLLARTLVDVGTRMGKRVVALLTDMDQPLGRAVGNALETAEAVEVLRGEGPQDLREVTLALAAEMLVLGEVAPDPAAARALALEALADGRALSRFEAMVAAQGGDPRVAGEPDRLPQAPERAVLVAPRAGFVTAIDAEAVGRAAMTLGAGRLRKEDPVDPAVGVVLHRKVGDAVDVGEPLCEVHLRSRGDLARVEAALLGAYSFDDRAPDARPLIRERLS